MNHFRIFPNEKTYAILTVSRVALKALVSYSVKLKLVGDCLDAISELVPYCKLTPAGYLIIAKSRATKLLTNWQEGARQDESK